MSKMTRDLTGDAGQAVAVLAWALEAGVVVSTVTVGGCTIEVGTSAVPHAERPVVDTGLQGMYRTMGGPAFSVMQETGIPDGELQPAVMGRTR